MIWKTVLAPLLPRCIRRRTTPLVDRQLPEPRFRQRIEGALEFIEESHGIDAGRVAVLDEIDDVHAPISPFKLAHKHLAIANPIGQLRLRHAGRPPRFTQRVQESLIAGIVSGTRHRPGSVAR